MNDLKIKPRVPDKHKYHTDEIRCDCCTDLDNAEFMCKCGACYGIGVYAFVVFTCYDCGRQLIKNYLKNIDHE